MRPTRIGFRRAQRGSSRAPLSRSCQRETLITLKTPWRDPIAHWSPRERTFITMGLCCGCSLCDKASAQDATHHQNTARRHHGALIGRIQAAGPRKPKSGLREGPPIPSSHYKPCRTILWCGRGRWCEYADSFIAWCGPGKGGRGWWRGARLVRNTLDGSASKIVDVAGPAQWKTDREAGQMRTTADGMGWASATMRPEVP